MTSERQNKMVHTSLLRAAQYTEPVDGHFSLAALPYSQMNELLNRTGDRMYLRPHDPPPPPPPMHPLGEIKPPSVIRWDRRPCTHTNPRIKSGNLSEYFSLYCQVLNALGVRPQLRGEMLWAKRNPAHVYVQADSGVKNYLWILFYLVYDSRARTDKIAIQSPSFCLVYFIFFLSYGSIGPQVSGIPLPFLFLRVFVFRSVRAWRQNTAKEGWIMEC